MFILKYILTLRELKLDALPIKIEFLVLHVALQAFGMRASK